jgi:hypothetical protein
LYRRRNSSIAFAISRRSDRVTPRARSTDLAVGHSRGKTTLRGTLVWLIEQRVMVRGGNCQCVSNQIRPRGLRGLPWTRIDGKM